MKMKIIHAIFDDEQDVLSVVKDLRDREIEVNEVYSPFPIHGLDPVLGLKETRMAITAFIYGCIGLTFGALLIYYIMISGVGKSWPMNIGGKPNFTFYHNLPSFVPIMFECTVLFAGHLMSITYLFRNKLYPGATTTSPDPRTTDDKFLVELTYTDNKDDIIALLKKSNVTEINEKDEI
ncbi:MAG: hypothetical protein CMD16_02030 [Flavobacteriales bacterium]|nr:hypothetical protein [Flavobacteriales bacterium]|tara:strand:- start:97182 stop:97718 length:537 start_codon:yes stop_codon:yes gene_type:complete